MILNKKTAILLLSIAVFHVHLFSQERKVIFGIKINPSISLTKLDKQSIIDKNHVTLLNNRVGLQIGLNSSYHVKNYIFDWNCFFGQKKTGFKFNINEFEYSNFQYNILSFVNKFSIGYRIKKSNKPYFDIFIGPSIGYELKGIFKQYGKSNMAYYSLSDSIVYTKNQNNFTVGLMIKVKTEIKKFGKISYGISFDYLHSIYPEINLFSVINGIETITKFTPRVHAISIDFIYYFNKR